MNNAKIHVIGVGGCGRNTVNHLKKLTPESERLRYFMLDNETYIQEAKEEKQTGYNELIAVSDNNALNSTLDGADIVLIVAGLGRRTGGEFSVTLAKMAKERGIVVLALPVTPFSWEGKKRENRAKDQIEQLRNECNDIYVFENKRLSRLLNQKKDTTLKELFGYSHTLVNHAVNYLLNLDMSRRENSNYLSETLGKLIP